MYRMLLGKLRRIRRGRSAVSDRAGLSWTEMVDVETSAVLDDHRQSEQAAIVERVGIQRVSDIGFISGEAPIIPDTVKRTLNLDFCRLFVQNSLDLRHFNTGYNKLYTTRYFNDNDKELKKLYVVTNKNVFLPYEKKVLK